MTKGLSSLVYDVGVRDPSIFGGTALVLGMIAITASWIPSMAAVRVDPVTAFREE